MLPRKTADDSTIWVSSDLGGSPYSAVVEDDGRVASAYLLRESSIVADVWLSNRATPPAVPEWNIGIDPPWLNPAEFVRAEHLAPILKAEEIELVWGGTPPHVSVTVLIRGEVWALLKPGAKPGWSRLAAKDGPLARPLAEIFTE
ncbi:MAG TPA: hypothetical protein VER17_07555 [Tepidisphaeraceae bacterium]|nr:hypothetical protein [Tepidisphaeraceae bacterium]